MKFQTKVGKFSVEVRGEAAIVKFKAGARGKHEGGPYAFWTALLREPRPYNGRTSRKVFGRARKVFGRAAVGLSAGDRFDRMSREQRQAKSKEDRAVYSYMWNNLLDKGGNIKYIRPSTDHEIKVWMKGHKSDAKFARRI